MIALTDKQIPCIQTFKKRRYFLRNNIFLDVFTL